MGNGNDKVTRRRALHVIGIGGLAVGLSPLAGCGGEESGGGGGGEAAGEGCNSPIPQAKQQLRSNLQYVDQSPHENKNCANCAQYVEGAFGDCGACNAFGGTEGGPVQASGYCLSWAAQGEGAGAAEKAG